MSRSAHNTGSLPLSLRFAQFDREPFAAASVRQGLVRTANALPGLLADLLHQAQNDDGRLNLSMHHCGLEELELHLGRMGNRQSLALATFGLYLAGSLLMLHSAGPRIWGDVPIFALVTCGLALLLSLRLVAVIARPGPL